MNAASAVGDDRIMRQTQGYAVPLLRSIPARTAVGE